VDVLERLRLVVHLDENRLGGHFPIHTVGLIGTFRVVATRNSEFLQEPLAFRPYRARSVERLKLDTNEILYLVILHGNEKVIDATARNGNFRNYMKFISGFVSRKQVKTVGEYLASLN
jgi:hypothetical protein